jgi:hypothetical protein
MNMSGLILHSVKKKKNKEEKKRSNEVKTFAYKRSGMQTI